MRSLRCDSLCVIIMCDYMLECCWTISNTFLLYISKQDSMCWEGRGVGYKEQEMLELKLEFDVNREEDSLRTRAGRGGGSVHIWSGNREVSSPLPLALWTGWLSGGLFVQVLPSELMIAISSVHLQFCKKTFCRIHIWVTLGMKPLLFSAFMILSFLESPT